MGKKIYSKSRKNIKKIESYIMSHIAHNKVSFFTKCGILHHNFMYFIGTTYILRYQV